jgi:hypothetical protein
MQFLIDQILRPVSHRMATTIGTFLGTLGYASDDVQTIVAAIPVAVGILIDLVVRKVL